MLKEMLIKIGRLGLTYKHYDIIEKKNKTNENLLYRTGKSSQYSIMTYVGKESLTSRYMYMHNINFQYCKK